MVECEFKISIEDAKILRGAISNKYNTLTNNIDINMGHSKYIKFMEQVKNLISIHDKLNNLIKDAEEITDERNITLEVILRNMKDFDYDNDSRDDLDIQLDASLNSAIGDLKYLDELETKLKEFRSLIQEWYDQIERYKYPDTSDHWRQDVYNSILAVFDSKFGDKYK